MPLHGESGQGVSDSRAGLFKSSKKHLNGCMVYRISNQSAESDIGEISKEMTFCVFDTSGEGILKQVVSMEDHRIIQLHDILFLNEFFENR